MKNGSFASVVVLFTMACGTSSSSPDATSKFTGTWRYEPGSTILAECAGVSPQTVDLSRVPPVNQPGYFSLSSTGLADLHEVDARGCEYDWSVTGETAAAASGQSCATFPDGHGGNRRSLAVGHEAYRRRCLDDGRRTFRHRSALELRDPRARRRKEIVTQTVRNQSSRRLRE
jgi:hypothetical protein